MKHPHAELFEAIANGESAGKFECHDKEWQSAAWEEAGSFLVSIYSAPEQWTVRRRPEMIELAGVTFPEPMRVAPAAETSYWFVSPESSRVVEYCWYKSSDELRYLKSGLCQATEQGAIAQRRAMILAVGGEP